MAWSQTDLDSIEAAIATGAREVEFGAGPDKRVVKYGTLGQMLAVRNMLANAVLGTARPRTSVIQHDRG